MDYTSRLNFLVLGFWSQDYGLIGLFLLILIFGFRFKFFQPGWLLKGLNLAVVQLFYQYCRSEIKNTLLLKFLRCLLTLVPEKRVKSSVVEDGEESERDHFDEDEEFDVVLLRKMVKSERERANEAEKELVVERWAADSAASEALAVILRAQGEKSRLELLAEHDRELIENLKWVVARNGEEIERLREELWLCQEEMNKVCPSQDIGSVQ